MSDTDNERDADGLGRDDRSDTEDNCPICLYPLSERGHHLVRTFGCGHKIHQSCIGPDRISSCPVCRRCLKSEAFCINCYKLIESGKVFCDTRKGKIYSYCVECFLNKRAEESASLKQSFLAMVKFIAHFEIEWKKMDRSVEEFGFTKAEAYDQMLHSFKNLMMNIDMATLENIT